MLGQNVPNGILAGHDPCFGMIIALVKHLDAGVDFSAASMARVSMDASAIVARLRDTSRGRGASGWWCSRCVARGVREHARE